MNIRIRSYFKRKGGKLVAVKGYSRAAGSKAKAKALGKSAKMGKGGKKIDSPLTYREWLSEIEGGKKSKKAKKETKDNTLLKDKLKKKKSKKED